MKVSIHVLCTCLIVGWPSLELQAQSADTPLKPYLTTAVTPNATGYATGRTWIIVQFKGDALYLYTTASCGVDHIRELKRLAKQGEGLDAYIRQHVWKSYASRLR